ncbi:MAG: polymer-forming cytoskeletal protein [Halofilum sp. (in: g-proteobacteria)]|nr:polymer-forming cytoskeletal protein [Halofilum sp. (in: g-proteobacteria)]
MLGGNTKKSRTANAKVETLIGHQTEITGNIHFEGGLHIDGLVKGNVTADNDSGSVAIVSEQGRIEGELRVPHILINGRVAGDVHAAERLDLATNARVEGDVYYRTIEMAGGAEINGKLVRTDKDPQRFLEHQDNEPHPAASGAESEARSSGEDDSDPTARRSPSSA